VGDCELHWRRKEPLLKHVPVNPVEERMALDLLHPVDLEHRGLLAAKAHVDIALQEAAQQRMALLRQELWHRNSIVQDLVHQLALVTSIEWRLPSEHLVQ
jgi:hypothetical protein